jgi:thioredoxin reductase (NADPH)
MENKVYDVAIIGSGSAALTAAIYSSRGDASTLILGGETWGGQLMLTTIVENFPGFPLGINGPDLMKSMRQQAERFGAEFIEKKVTAVNFKTNPFELTVENQTVLAKIVIIATGAQTSWLGVPGEKELLGRGVSTCATCDAAFFKEQRVAVVGGGDTAMEEALALAKFATEVTIIHRRDQFRASEVMQKKVLQNKKIKILWNTEVEQVLGVEKVEQVNLINNKTNKKTELKIDGIFVAVGHKPESELFTNQIETDEKGFLKVVSGHAQTSVSGVFVAGDVMDSVYKQAITAAGSGCAAGMEALAYLDKS